MKENEDYIVAQDPDSTDDRDWIVLIRSGEWENFIVKYSNIELVDENKDIKYDLEMIFVPDKFREVEVTEKMQSNFYDHCGALIDHIMADFHERGVNLYIDKETGEKIEY